MRPTTAAVYAIIYALSDGGENFAAPSAAQISEWTGVSRKTVLTALKQLCEGGYLAKESRNKENGEANAYKPTAGTISLDVKLGVSILANLLKTELQGDKQ